MSTALRVCIYEDQAYRQFYPLTYLRPIYLLRSGIVPLAVRVQRFFPGAELTLVVREQVAALTAEIMSDYPVNIVKRTAGQEVLFLNGRIRDYGNLPELVRNSRLSTRFTTGSETVAILYKRESLDRIPSMATPDPYLEAISAGGDMPDYETSATLYNHLWDIVADIDKEITEDFQFLQGSGQSSVSPAAMTGVFEVNRAKILYEQGVVIKPSVVIDASQGPVYIGANTVIESQAVIIGPCYVGANSVVVPGKISGSSIGPVCRVGGEVEESVFQSYVNKFHAGFIGHSYVGAWVNFGAMTTNSDLKNNYGTIRCSVNGQSIDTGMIKVGSFIGDHTKFGIGTLLNTGITIGVGCNIFGAGLTSDKEVASFSWGNTGSYTRYELDKMLAVARTVAGRRKTKLSAHEEAILTALYQGSYVEGGEVAV